MFLKLVLFCCIVAVATARSQPHIRPRLPEPLVEGRIAGSAEAEPGEFPHQISLHYGFASNFVIHFCGGSILNEYWILTAAHCPLAVSSSLSLFVKAGKHSIRVSEKGEQVVKVARFFTHEKFVSNGEVGPFDVALLKLEKPLVFDERVQPIGLPEPDSEVTGDVVVSGWGSIDSGSQKPDKLQKAKLPIVDVHTCKKALEDLIGRAPVDSSNVCTGPLTGGQATCGGDSGGPLIKIHEDGHREIVGIVSWSISPCGLEGAPSVYTRVSSYIDWIENIMAKY